MRENDRKIALLTAVAAVLQTAESFFPQVVPGVKLGLANMIVLIALVNIGFKAAIEIAVMRTIIGSLILGTFLSPGFVLSLASAITSTLAMGTLYRFSAGHKGGFFLSLTGISIVGAMIHNLTQLGLVYLLLIKTPAIFLLLPWLGISSVIMGWITGITASGACAGLDKAGKIKTVPARQQKALKTGPSAPVTGRYISKDSPVHSLAPEIKIFIILSLAVLVLVINVFYGYLILLLGLIASAFAAKIPVTGLFDGVKRLYFFIIISFALPAVFTEGGRVLFTAGIINITQEGLREGGLFALRLILLMAGAAMLVRTTSPKELAEGIRKLLRPLSFTGISGERVSKMTVSSLVAVPAMWDRARAYMKNLKPFKRELNEIVPALSGLIVMLYLGSGEKETFD